MASHKVRGRQRYTLARARCSVCGRDVACDVPWRGDGSCYVYRRHVDPAGIRCSKSRMPVPHDHVLRDGSGYRRPRQGET